MGGALRHLMLLTAIPVQANQEIFESVALQHFQIFLGSDLRVKLF